MPATLDNNSVIAAVRNLGGHDLDALAEAFGEIEDTRPNAIFASGHPAEVVVARARGAGGQSRWWCWSGRGPG